MPDLAEYQTPDGRTFQLTPEDAKALGAKPVAAKARVPANKARTPDAKSDERA